jgi:rhodanese-related sulfurtransferase
MSAVEIPTVDADRAAAHDGAFFLDVREVAEWIHGHIDGTVNIPLGELTDRVGEVPRDRPVIVICRSGNRSALATQLLCSIGVDAYNMSGGVAGWFAAGRPIGASTGRPGVVV